MKPRYTFYIVLSVLFALFFVGCATALQTRYSSYPADWLHAHRVYPVMWLIDLCALYTLALSGYAIRYQRLVQLQSREMLRLREEHLQQLDELTAQAEELEKTNAAYAEQATSLNEEKKALQSTFEAEARRLTEQAFRALQGQVDANTRQMEAINLALQYHRGELKELRHNLRHVHPSSEAFARLTAAPDSLVGKEMVALPGNAHGELSGTESEDEESEASLVPPFLLRAARKSADSDTPSVTTSQAASEEPLSDTGFTVVHALGRETDGSAETENPEPDLAAIPTPSWRVKI